MATTKRTEPVGSASISAHRDSCSGGEQNDPGDFDAAVARLLRDIYGSGAGAAGRFLRTVLDAHPVVARVPVPGGPEAGSIAGGNLSAEPSGSPGAGSPQEPAPVAAAAFDRHDVLLITYADMLDPKLREETRTAPSLPELAAFSQRFLPGMISHIHILPFHPASSDGGFSVVDYRSVDPAYGDWQDIAALGGHFRLAFDLVLNHASVRSAWFRAFLAGDPDFDGWFVTRPPDFDYRAVFRPRTHPLFTEFTRPDGSAVRVWTTFSADQADLDFSNPRVLAEFADLLLRLLERGARIVRLDAIAFLWKEDGHACLHHPNTHRIVKLFRRIIDRYAPGAILLTETNVPHRDNVSYFGDGDEAHMVYNFALPPLTLHAFASGTATFLATWAAGLPERCEGRYFLNFLASHDGIGVTPARGILGEEGMRLLLETVTERGGLVSSRSTPDGIVPYELNTTWLSAVAPPDAPRSLMVAAFLASHAVCLFLAGVPAIYFHSLVGSRNPGPAARYGDTPRDINRIRLDRASLEAELGDAGSIRHDIFLGLRAMIGARSARPAFAPDARQRILDPGRPEAPVRSGDPASPGPVFGILRGGGDDAAVVLVNTSDAPAVARPPAGFSASAPPFDPRLPEAGAHAAAAGQAPSPGEASPPSSGARTRSEPVYAQQGPVLLPPYGVVIIDGTMRGETACT